MREIKLRAWDNKRGTLVEDCSLYRINGTWETDEYDGKFGKEISLGVDLELMQFTGLKDKNGKDIYEGDIIHCDNGSYGVVTYIPENMMYQIDSKGGFCHPVYGYAPPLEVLGNIYENKDLLK